MINRTKESSNSIATTENVNRKNWRFDDKDQTPGTFITSAARLGGNMSPKFNQPGEILNDYEKEIRAKTNLETFIQSLGFKPENVFIMLPQQSYPPDLGIVNVDEVFKPGDSTEPVVAEKRADLLVTRNPDTVLICRPADCPVLSIVGKDASGNDVLAQLHVGWQGLNAGYLEQGITYLLEEQGVTKESLRIQMSGAGYAEHFPYNNTENPLDDNSVALDKDGNELPKRFTHPERDRLFVNVKNSGTTNEFGQAIYEFAMDMPGFIRSTLEKLGVSTYQLYEEGSDTASIESGYSSHSRDAKEPARNTRDAVLATLSSPDQKIIRKFHQSLLGKKAII